MPRHDSLNLRKEVTLPINYEGKKAHCPHAEINLAPSLRPVRHYLYLLDIDPGPMVLSGTSSLSETSADRHTVRAAKTEEV
jgi:hypothetical protein